MFSIDDWEESWSRVGRADHRIQLSVPELDEELTGLAGEALPGGSAEFPFVLSAGERRSFTANTIVRNPAWRKKGADGALTISRCA